MEYSPTPPLPRKDVLHAQTSSKINVPSSIVFELRWFLHNSSTGEDSVPLLHWTWGFHKVVSSVILSNVAVVAFLTSVCVVEMKYTLRSLLLWLRKGFLEQDWLVMGSGNVFCVNWQ